MDENLVEATQALRALEEGDEEDFYPIEASAPSPEPEEERPAKKSKGETNGSSHGMLGGDALDNIKFYAEMARKQAEEERRRKVPVKAGITGLLGGYESD